MLTPKRRAVCHAFYSEDIGETEASRRLNVTREKFRVIRDLFVKENYSVWNSKH